MVELFKDFLLMLQFLTRLPINISLPCEKENFRKGTAFFPLVGLIIGGIELGFYFVFKSILPISITAVLLVLIGILLTGGLHVDGIGDTCDGFFAFKGKNSVIEIMKDSRIGTYACISIVFDILIKYTALSFALQKGAWEVILLAPILGRGSILILSFIGKPAKPKGTGNFFIHNVGISELIIGILSIVVFSYILVGVKSSVICIVFVIIMTFLFNKLCMHKMNGITGDSLGANNELNEMLILILFTAILKL